MGVLACDRKGCTNVMCDYISHERGEYLCQECRDELINKGVCSLEEFMNSEKVVIPQSNEAWEEFVRKVYPIRGGY